jgi:transglutaminase-like putative cysteine protease
MPAFRLRHASTYTYASPVQLAPHSLYLRPRSDHRLKLNSATLTLSPLAEVVWRNDLYGNSVAIAAFQGATQMLEIISELEVETFPRSEEQRRMLLSIGRADYSRTEARVLDPFMNVDNETAEFVTQWVSRASTGVEKTQYERLLECAARIRYEFDYRPRYEPGLQSPRETLGLFSGTCRDFAELMIAAARTLGCAARFVTGYVFTPNAAPGSSSPHAWAEVYLPAIGWTEIDATNGLVDDGDLIPVASAVSGHNLSPITGAYTGAADASMTVAVDVVRLQGPC